MPVATDPDLADEIETIHYRFTVTREPHDAVIAVARLLEAIPDWLDDLAAEEPALRWGTDRITRGQWMAAADSLEAAGTAVFRQLELVDSEQVTV